MNGQIEVKEQIDQIAVDVLRARIALGRAIIDEEEKRRLLVVAKARAEAKVIESAGGERALGSNQAARDRALTLSVAQDKDYKRALEAYVKAQEERHLAEARLEAERIKAKALLYLLQVGGDGRS